jgi:hypothetical protein
MPRDTRLLRTYQACLVLGGAFAAFVLLDVGLAATGVYPWTDVGPAVFRLALGIAIAVLSFVVAMLVWRERDDRNLGGATFSDAVIALGFMLVGGFLLLGLLR